MWQAFGHSYAKNILEKILKTQQFANCYLFEGPSGIGKLTIAKEFASKIVSGSASHPDILIHDLAVAGSIVEVREFLQRLSYAPVQANHLVGIIDNIDSATPQVANSLLKTLEEAGQRTVIILVSSTRQLLPTIISRAQVIHFNSFSEAELRSYASDKLSSEVKETESAINLCAGSLGKLQNLLADSEKLTWLEEQVNTLTKVLFSKDYVEKIVLVNKIAELEKDQTFELMQSWLGQAPQLLKQHTEHYQIIRNAMQVIPKLKQNFNKKMVLQHFLVNT